MLFNVKMKNSLAKMNNSLQGNNSLTHLIPDMTGCYIFNSKLERSKNEAYTISTEAWQEYPILRLVQTKYAYEISWRYNQKCSLGEFETHKIHSESNNMETTLQMCK